MPFRPSKTMSMLKYDYLINVLHLKASVGKLTEQDIQEMNAWLVDKARL